MRPLILTCAALMSTAASAADLPRRAPLPTPPPAVVQQHSWAGCYLGAHGGYAWSGLNLSIIDEAADLKPTGVVYGGQAGCNWQHGNIVYGGEVDFSAFNRRATQAIGEASLSGNIDYVASLRARLGYAPSAATLFYLTGGPAWGHSQGTLLVGETAAQAAATHFGWAGGGGVELAFSPNWIARFEALHYDLGRSTWGFSAVPLNSSARLSVDVIRAGFSYKFN